ncbi:nuclear transport factor 2 family protein [Sphingomonas aliaeris]|uniref:Nuclear transport factor 2 family protein n=1 Tax=Sphingomonas aliaeris TaxID=2759526 RepID=A0A974NTP0_9SPHN|nr:nuclear transport factor 2 family protein [Sphingomonas aliaeris]QQV76727.1 nuclear transport factor 2 family protein [Sphingomonas aliaeris]
MDDDRVWAFEESLWTGDAEHYRELIDEACTMVLLVPPFVFSGQHAVEAVAATPRWTKASFSDQRIARPEEGLIVVAYHIAVERDEEKFAAYCTSTYRRRAHDDWQVVQHQQTVPLTET